MASEASEKRRTMETDRRKKMDEAVTKKMEDAYEGLAAALTEAGVEFKWFENKHPFSSIRPKRLLQVPEVSLEIREERWRSEFTRKGRIRISVGSYGEKSQFPERKQGFNFEAIVKAIQDRIDAQKERRAKDKERDRASKVAQAAYNEVFKQVGEVKQTTFRVDRFFSGLEVVVEGLDQDTALRVMRALKDVLGGYPKAAEE